MLQTELDVPAELLNSIRGFWYRDIDFGTSPSAFEVLPDGHAEIIFYFGSDFSLLHNGQMKPLTSPFIVGLLQQPIYFQSVGRLQIIGIKCLPWAVYDILEMPPANGGVQTFAHPIALLQSGLHTLLATGKIDEALALVRDWFLKNKPAMTPEILKAGEAMLAANGSLPVSSVAAAAHATVRTLERKFKASSGHTMKDVSGLIRFEQVRNRIWENPEINISGLAYELGYADQSHLNREFKRFSGLTAAAFAKRKKQISEDFVAIVLSS